jgi:penicillin-binding protein 1A
LPIEKTVKPASHTLRNLFFAAFGLLGVVGGVLYAQLQELPDIANLNDFKTSEATHIYDINGNLVSQLWLEQRTIVTLDQIPETLQNAVIATEDERFYEHWGIDVVGVARAFMVNLTSGGLREGASTITQQLARTLFLTQEKTLSRKIREALLSVQIEKNYSKKQILEMYLNDIYYGEGAYGVESAARTYFGKHLADLTLPECAMLAGIPKSPSHFDPYKFPLEALKRRNLVLERMVSTNFITQQEATDAKNTPWTLTPGPFAP